METIPMYIEVKKDKVDEVEKILLDLQKSALYGRFRFSFDEKHKVEWLKIEMPDNSPMTAYIIGKSLAKVGL